MSNTRKQSLFVFDTNAGALSLAHTAVHFKQTRFFNNSIPAVVLHNSDLHFHGINVFRNNTGGQCGGALVLLVDSQIHLHLGTQVYILDNSALKYGGGICVDDGSVPGTSMLCFYQVVDLDALNNSATFVYMARNTASITGYMLEMHRTALARLLPQSNLLQQNLLVYHIKSFHICSGLDS